ncbi:cytochrome P450 [Suillus clintonianus]|uniref:cytochrome P450 n=1 Tax=Suillus clintonianus TaxID=1904413 RepID=UPI001B8805DF|nr:cytochrome P450 [Suillus clintonianus]KAG2153341.1 cytochrome P450 [Suillus clintonianus]
MPSDLHLAVYGAVLFVPLFLAWRSASKNSSLLPLPPGPRLLPFVGNAFDIDVSRPWLTYTNWKEKHGDIVYSRVLGQHIIIIGSIEVARELLDKRSTTYSDRPVLRANEEFGISFNTAYLPYGETLRIHRKLFHQAFGAEASAEYHDLYFRKAYQLVIDLLSTPQKLEKHIEMYSGSVIITATYGYEAPPDEEGDPLIRRTREATEIAKRVMAPERAALLMAFPFLGYLPSWFPGASDRRLAPYSRKLVRQMLDEPFEIGKEKMTDGRRSPSIVAKFLDAGDISPAQEEFMKGVAVSGFVAGTETTASSLHSFLLAMLLHPDAQSRALAEIDAVCGDNVPNFEHKPSLPYIEAICREVLRWQPIVPLGLPHMTSQDDVYEGYFIPKGSMVVVNEWALSRDESLYPEASRFDPQRHLTAEGKLKDDPLVGHFAFGFGRRICPGRHFAELSLWAAMVSILSTVRITKAKDSEGIDIPVIPEYTAGLAIQPKPFACTITSINSRREEHMRAAFRVN